MRPVVVGLDTRTRAFHWVCDLRLGGDRYGWVERPDREDVEISRAELYRQARLLFQSLPVGSHVFCEEPLALQNGQTTRLLNLAAGAIWAAFVQSNVSGFWYWIGNTNWKREILGRGSPPNRGKHKPWIEETLLANDEFIQWTEAELGTRGDFLSQTDLFDAWCLMRYGVLHSRHGRT